MPYKKEPFQRRVHKVKKLDGWFYIVSPEGKVVDRCKSLEVAADRCWLINLKRENYGDEDLRVMEIKKAERSSEPDKPDKPKKKKYKQKRERFNISHGGKPARVRRLSTGVIYRSMSEAARQTDHTLWYVRNHVLHKDGWETVES